MATLGGNVYLNGGSRNYLPSGNICGTGFFYASSSNENSLACAYFFQSSYNAGIVMTAAFQDFACNKSQVVGCACFLGNSKNEGTVCTALFSGNAINSGIIKSSGSFFGTSQNKGTVSGNALFAITASNVGGFVSGSISSYTEPTSTPQVNYNQIGNFIYTGYQFSDVNALRGTGIMASGTGVFYNNSRNTTSIINGVFFNDSFNQLDMQNDYLGSVIRGYFYDNSHNENQVCCASFYNNARNLKKVKTGFFYNDSINFDEVSECAIFYNNSKNSGTVMGDALFLDNSSNISGWIIGNACFASTATNGGFVQGIASSYIPSGKDWTQTSSYINLINTVTRSLPNLFSINNNGEKAIVRTSNSAFKAYSLDQTEYGGYRSWEQLGSINVGGDFVSIVDSGNTVSMNGIGNRVAIGNASDAISGIYNYGSVTVYDYDLFEDMWSAFPYNHKFTSDPNICFGRSVSLNFNGDRVAIGAPGAFNYSNSTSGNGAISIYCWYQDENNQSLNRWDLMSNKLIFGLQGEKIGKSVKLNEAGDKIVFSTLSGFKVYEAIDDWDWMQMGSTINLPNASQHQLLEPEKFGQVSINNVGDKVLVSQLRLMPEDLTSASGVVVAYCWNGLSWNQMGSVLRSEYPDDYFGLDIEMNGFGDKIIIGANNSLAGTQDYGRGRALIYDWNGSDWVKNNYELGKPDLNKAPTTYYGQQVSIVGSGNVAYATNQVSGVTLLSRYEIL